MKHRDLVAALERAGCVLLRNGAKHDIYHNPISGKSVLTSKIGDDTNANASRDIFPRGFVVGLRITLLPLRSAAVPTSISLWRVRPGRLVSF